MPSFHDTTTTPAAPEQVWKILYDPASFPDRGVLCSSWREGRAIVSCLVSDLTFEWRLEPAGDGTRISVEVQLPEAEAHQLDTQREVIGRSLARLAALAAGG